MLLAKAFAMASPAPLSWVVSTLTCCPSFGSRIPCPGMCSRDRLLRILTAISDYLVKLVDPSRLTREVRDTVEAKGVVFLS